MLAYNPAQRLTMAELKESQWFKGPVPSYDEVLEEFKRRKEINDEEQEKEKAVKRV